MTTTYVYDAMGQLTAEYGAPPTDSGTTYLTADHLGSTRFVSASDGSLKKCYDYLPFGEELQQGMGGRGSCYPANVTNPYPGSPDAESMKFTGKERDAETGLDYFGARHFSSPMGRFMSPDPFGGHLGDPQTLNRYVYGRNNPLKYTDSTGLDFYLDCEENSETCQGGHVGTTRSDENGKNVFEPTLVTNGKNGTLVDQHEREYSGNFDINGVHFADSNGNQYSGSFAEHTDPTSLSGAGDIFGGFKAVFNGTDLKTNVATGTLFGTDAQFKALLPKLVGPNVGLDALNPFHPGAQYRGGNDNGPDAHLSYIPSQRAADNPSLIANPFHFDVAYPFVDAVGFAEHTYSVVSFLFKKFILQQTPTPAPVSLPH